MGTISNATILTRNDTASNWTTENPTLRKGEIGIETDTNKFKVGDGTTAWTSLDYMCQLEHSITINGTTFDGSADVTLSIGGQVTAITTAEIEAICV